MIKFLCGLGLVMLGAGAFSAPAGAQTATDQPAANPVCARFEAQLANVNRGSADPARADLIRHAEEAVAKQQADLDRTSPNRAGRAARGSAAFLPCSPASRRSARRSIRRSSRCAATSTG